MAAALNTTRRGVLKGFPIAAIAAAIPAACVPAAAIAKEELHKKLNRLCWEIADVLADLGDGTAVTITSAKDQNPVLTSRFIGNDLRGKL